MKWLVPLHLPFQIVIILSPNWKYNSVTAASILPCTYMRLIGRSGICNLRTILNFFWKAIEIFSFIRHRSWIYRLFWSLRAAHREWISLAHGMGTVVFTFFVGTVMSEITFGRWKNAKPVRYYYLPRFVSLKRGASVRQSKKTGPKILK